MNEAKAKSAKRVFTFSKGDYSSIYNEADYINNDSTISRLIEINKLSSINILNEIERFRTQNAEFISELNSDSKSQEMNTAMVEYQVL